MKLGLRFARMGAALALGACVAALFDAQAMAATTYWVRADGNDTNCDGKSDVADSLGVRPNCSFRTLQKGVQSATTSGDTVYVRSGDYSSEGTIVVSTSGSAESYTTVQAVPRGTVTVSRIGTERDYVKFDGLRITGSAGYGAAGAIMSGNNGYVSNCYFVGNNDIEVVYGVQVDGGSYNTIIGNTFDGHFHIVFSVHKPMNRFENNLIQNVPDCERVWDAGPAPSSNSNDTIVKGNEVRNLTKPGKYYTHVDIFQVVNQGGTNIANRWIVENNYFHDVAGQVGINEAAQRSTGWIFRNNVFANITEAMMLLSPNTKLYNNTFFQCGQEDGYPIHLGEPGIEIKNNIVIGRSSNTALGMYANVPISPLPEFANNAYSLPMSSGYAARDAVEYNKVKGIGSINGVDPRFTAAYNNCVTNTCDFSLRSDSPLIDAGANLSAVWPDAKDLAGTSRPQGSGWDIGGFEFVGGSGVMAPSNLRVVP